MLVREILAEKKLLSDVVVGAKIGGIIYDLHTEYEAIPKDDEIKVIDLSSDDGLEIMRHSCAHVMAQAVKELFPDALLSIGPTTENGFFYDFFRPESFSEEDIKKIEERMEKIIEKNLEFKRTVVSKSEAEEIFKNKKEELKLEILKDIVSETVSIYKQGDFIDLCRGPHLPSTGYIRSFKITSVSAVHFKGDQNRIMLSRIQGVAFASEDDLKKYFELLEEIKKRDHRTLGRELELFLVDDYVGPGLILWLPKGARVRKIVEDLWLKLHEKYGYKLVYSPHIARAKLWDISGHRDLYKDFMYPIMKFEEEYDREYSDFLFDSYQLKPMNCPFHITIFLSKTRSYKDLPMKLCEFGTVYRYEKSGVLHGLLRVRGFTQDDAHIFLRMEQIEEEVGNVLELVVKMLNIFGFSEYQVFLSTRPSKRAGTDDEWDYAENSLSSALKGSGLSFSIDPGEGVFYGPKIDLKVKDSIGRMWQCSTVQLDFNLPKKFNLTYVGQDNRPHRVYMIHRAIFGSMERFFGILLEHYSGNLLAWLAPVQCVVIDIQRSDWADLVWKTLYQNGIRAEYDSDTESRLSKRIRYWEVKKVPYIIVVGKREEQTKTISIRKKGGDIKTMDLLEGLSFLKSVCSIPQL